MQPSTNSPDEGANESLIDLYTESPTPPLPTTAVTVSSRPMQLSLPTALVPRSSAAAVRFNKPQQGSLASASPGHVWIPLALAEDRTYVLEHGDHQAWVRFEFSGTTFEAPALDYCKWRENMTAKGESALPKQPQEESQDMVRSRPHPARLAGASASAPTGVTGSDLDGGVGSEQTDSVVKALVAPRPLPPFPSAAITASSLHARPHDEFVPGYAISTSDGDRSTSVPAASSSPPSAASLSPAVHPSPSAHGNIYNFAGANIGNLTLNEGPHRPQIGTQQSAATSRRRSSVGRGGVSQQDIKKKQQKYGEWKQIVRTRADAEVEAFEVKAWQNFYTRLSQCRPTANPTATQLSAFYGSQYDKERTEVRNGIKLFVKAQDEKVKKLYEEAEMRTKNGTAPSVHQLDPHTYDPFTWRA